MLVVEQALAEFFPTLAREKYRYRATDQLLPPLTRFYEPYSDIFSPDTINRLRQEKAATDPYFDTKYCRLTRLINTVTELYLEQQLLPLTTEIRRVKQQLSILWQDQQLPLRAIKPILATLPAASARRDLYRQYRQTTAILESLYRELITRAQSVINSLEYPSLQEFALPAPQAETLSQQALTILSETESAYRLALAKYSNTYLALPIAQLHQADLYYWQALTPFAHWLTTRPLFAVYQETLTGLGIKFGKLAGLQLQWLGGFNQARPSDHWSSTVCQPVQIPQEIYLLASAPRTPMALTQFFGSFGQALFYSFTAADLAPAFKYPPDNGLRLLFQQLFANLVTNPLWLEQMFGPRPWPTLQQAFTLSALYHWRAAAAEFLADCRLYGQQRAEPETAASELTAATGFTAEADLYWQHHTSLFRSAAELPAIVGEFLLREHLMTRYGWRWWTNPRAGKLLQEIWATGSRYSITMIISQLGMGPLQPESLIATVNQVLKP
jgi:hypothetical protein